MKQTGSKQVPWEASSLVGAFFSGSPTVDPAAIERETWETIRNSNDSQDYKEYLQIYPTGTYAVAARAKIRQIETAKTTPSNTGGNPASVPTSAPPPKGFKSRRGIEMVYIPPGRFMMGLNPAHEVKISYSFYMGKYEVTQAQWKAVMSSNPSFFVECGDTCPVEQVLWNDAQDFIGKLNEANDGYTYRLPSEAEWEYACRAGTTGDFYSEDVDDIGWYDGNSGRRTHAVGGKQPNAFGLYDMSGNVWEWCKDWYHLNYDGAPTDGRAWSSGGSDFDRVLRGGSVNNESSHSRSVIRFYRSPDFHSYSIGFRVVAVPRTQ